jgi:hypothetical protein
LTLRSIPSGRAAILNRAAIRFPTRITAHSAQRKIMDLTRQQLLAAVKSVFPRAYFEDCLLILCKLPTNVILAVDVQILDTYDTLNSDTVFMQLCDANGNVSFVSQKDVNLFPLVKALVAAHV